jgi:hypothetical protein
MVLGTWRKWLFRALCLAVVVTILVFGTPYVLTEIAVRKVLENPCARLSEAEFRRVQRYCRTNPWWRLPGSTIALERQLRLAEVAVERATEIDRPDVWAGVSHAWLYRKGRFPTLPYAVAQSVLRKEPGSSLLLLTLAEQDIGLRDFRPWLDAEFLLDSGDTYLVQAAMILLTPQDLAPHQKRCLQLLSDTEYRKWVMNPLILQVAEAGEGARWFSGHVGLLEQLRESASERERKAIDEILAQIREAETGGRQKEENR